jgi:hypothetical protein
MCAMPVTHWEAYFPLLRDIILLIKMIAFFSESEIVTGDRIVNGSSCDVYDIIEFRQQRRVREILGDEVSFVRDFLARNVRHSKTLNPMLEGFELKSQSVVINSY